MFRSSNPTLNPKAFADSRSYGVGGAMTVQGTINKTYILFFLLFIVAAWVWNNAYQTVDVVDEFGLGTQARTLAPVTSIYIMVGMIGGFITAMITIFKKNIAHITAPIYALFEGLFVGGLSAFFELQYSGIVIQAVALTFATLFCMLGLYKAGIIKVTQKFRMGMMAALGAVMLFYLVSWIVSFFNPSFYHTVGLSYTNTSPMAIGLNLLIVGLAALSLTLDFDMIENGANMGVPKHMEWYGAFGLMVTLVWLYIELLRLLARFRGRD